MNKKNKFLINFTLVFIFLFFVLFFYAFEGNKKEQIISEEEELFIKEGIHNKLNENYNEIFIEDFTHFEWDKIYVFNSYITENEINKYIGFNWSKNNYSSIFGYENFTLFIFFYKNEVIGDIEFHNFELDFSINENGSIYTKGVSKFNVLKKINGDEEIINKTLKIE